MAYFIFGKNLDGIENTLYKIAENQSDLNLLNINQNDYKIIEDSNSNFNSVKYNTKNVVKYKDSIITYIDSDSQFKTKEELSFYISNFKLFIDEFLKNNKNHSLYGRWDNYKNQLNNFDTSTITFPFNKSLEQHFNDIGQTSLSPLQLP